MWTKVLFLLVLCSAAPLHAERRPVGNHASPVISATPTLTPPPPTPKGRPVWEPPVPTEAERAFDQKYKEMVGVDKWKTPEGEGRMDVFQSELINYVDYLRGCWYKAAQRLDAEDKSTLLTASQIRQQLNDDEYDKREAAEAYLKAKGLRLLPVMKQALIDAKAAKEEEVIYRLGQVLQAFFDESNCVHSAERFYAAKLFRTIDPKGEFKPCAGKEKK